MKKKAETQPSGTPDAQSGALDEAESFACGALFTLALYSSCLESGAHVHHAGSVGPWGVRFDDIIDAYTKESFTRAPSGWAWHLVAPSGLCGRVFAALNIKPSSAVGLLSLPEGIHPLTTAGQKSALLAMVSDYASHLDSGISFTAESPNSALAHLQNGSTQALDLAQTASALSLSDTMTSSLPTRIRKSADECAGEADLDSATSGTPHDGDSDAPHDDKEKALPAYTRAEIESQEEEALRNALTAMSDDPEAQERIEAQNKAIEESALRLTEGTALPESAFSPANVYQHRASPTSVQALRWVLAACAGPSPPATAEGATTTAEAEANQRSLRWYDARARSACVRLAHWLRIPSATFTALESHALSALEQAANAGETKDGSLGGYYKSRNKWLKVGAAAVGGGVLTAVTAGLAAPAIVAGIGTMVGMTGSTAAGAAITGAAATTTSVGIVTGGSGAAGAAYYSSKMAKRAADVSEFGFVRFTDWDEYQRQADADGEGADGETRGAAPGGGGEGGDGDANAGLIESPSTAQDAAAAAAPVASPPKHKTSWWSSRRKSSGSSSSKGRYAKMDKDGEQAAVLDQSSSSQCVDPMKRLLTFVTPESGGGSLLLVINGWLAMMSDFVTPFHTLDRRRGDAAALVWESKELLEISAAFMKMLTRNAGQQAVQLALYTTVQGLATAIVWPVAVLNCASLIDSAWDIACSRAEKAGKLLAHMLIARCHGDRPVTLLSVSIGARLAFHCCLELYKQGAYGIVEHLVLLGAPVSADKTRWQMARCVVSGRVVNGYSTTDWLLALCYRANTAKLATGASAYKRIAGMGAVKVPGVEDLNMTALVKNHGDWCKNMDRVLRMLGMGVNREG